MQINLHPTSERGASRDAVNRPRETLGDSHLISSDPRSRFGLVCDLLCCRGNNPALEMLPVWRTKARCCRCRGVGWQDSGIMSRTRNSVRTWASRRSVFLVLSAITLSFLGLASTTFSAKGSTSSTNQT